MFAYIEGKIVYKAMDQLILDHQGIGFLLNFDPMYSGRLPAQGGEGRIWIHFNLREDGLTLYAFPNQEEKQLFELLISVSGIGPKLAGAICAQMNPSQFALAILSEDLAQLTTIKGVGKKGAQRMVLELKDKLKGRIDLSGTSDEPMLQVSPEESSAAADALSALLVLGYRGKEADQAIQKAFAAKPEATVEDLIRLALRELAVKG